MEKEKESIEEARQHLVHEKGRLEVTLMEEREKRIKLEEELVQIEQRLQLQEMGSPKEVDIITLYEILCATMDVKSSDFPQFYILDIYSY